MCTSESTNRSAAEKASWAHYYGEQLTWYTHARNVLHHLPLLQEVRRTRPRSILEIGAGTGSLAIALSYLCPRVTSVDVVDQLVERCRLNNRHLRGRAMFLQGDAFRLSAFAEGEFDVVYSQGFFEHFDDEQIRQLIDEQLRVARCVVLSLPNRRYGKQDRGDERLLSSEDWEAIFRGLGVTVQTSREYSPINEQVWRRPRTMYLATLRSA